MCKKKIIKPVIFEAVQSAGEGKSDARAPVYYGYPVKDDRLAGMEIPVGVDAEAFLKGCEKMLQNVPIVMQAVTEPLEMSQKGSGIVTCSEKLKIFRGSEIANFEVKPILREMWCDRNGNEHPEFEAFFADVYIIGKFHGRIRVRTQEISNLTKIIKRRFSTAIVNFDEPNAEKILEAEFREQTAAVPTQMVLYQAGWQMIDGKMKLIHDAIKYMQNVKIQTGAELPYYSEWGKKEAAQTMLQVLQLSRETESNYIMVLFSLLGLLFKPFELSSHRIQFLLFVTGKTGAMKTAVSKVLFTQMTNGKYRNNVRRVDADTQASMERALVKSGCDTVILFDDYAPAKTAHKKAEMQNKLEALVRQVGDGATKSRSNGKLDDVQGEGLKGVVVVTGELKGKGVSSNLRCLYCEMQRGMVDTEKLSLLQHNEKAYTTVLHFFAEFLSENWNLVISQISTGMSFYRGKFFGILTEKRVIDMAATMAVTADIFQNFMVDFCEEDFLFVDKIHADMQEIILKSAMRNEAMAQTESYSAAFLKAVNALMGSGKIVLCKGKMRTEHVSSFDGFEDEKNFYFLPELTFSKAVNFMGQTRQYLPYDQKDMVMALFEDGIIKAHSNGEKKRTFYARIDIGEGKKQSFLKISKEIFFQVVNADTFSENYFRANDYKEEK